MIWIFKTTWIVDQAQHTKTFRISAKDQITAYRKYCALEWVKELSPKEFESVIITLEK